MASATPINGKVADAVTGEAIIGASVIYNNKVGAVTDVEGRFHLDIASFPSDISVSYVGYESLRVKIGERDSVVSIRLHEDAQTLNEVVVVGYGTQKRTQLTGSVTTISKDVLNNNVFPTADALLAGSVAGVQVTTSGQPGSGSSIRIRGGNSISANNEPLYVIDGLIYYKESGPLNTGERGTGISGGISPLSLINPNDIESIEVLKDVSATAIYGSRGANGVIIVTTKKGKRNQTNIKYQYQLTYATPSKKLSVLNATEWARYQKQYFYNKGGYTDEQIDALGTGTDWQDAVLRSTVSHSHNLTISGGDEKTRFLLGANIIDQKGIVLSTGFNRTALRLNADRRLTDKLTVEAALNVSRNMQDGLTTTTGVSFNSSPYQGGITNSLTYALLMPPVVPIYKADGSYNYTNPYEYAYFAMGDIAANPVSDLENSVAQSIDDDIIGNASLTYEFTDGLVGKASLGFDLDNLTQNYFAPHYTALGLANGGTGSIAKRRLETWQTEFTLNYRHNFGRSNQLDALAGYTYQTTNRTFLTGSSSKYTDESLKQNNLSGGSLFAAPLSGESSSNLHSLIGRVNYTLLDRYNATATFRADRSSRFSQNHNWGMFPSLGLSWNVNRERFLANQKWLSSLKLRASIGTVGNQEIGDYQYSTAYTTSTTGSNVHYTKSNAANSNLKWETTVSGNIGIDASVLQDRIGITLEYYQKKTLDLLLNVPVDVAKYGVSSQLQNVGNVENKGFEISVDFTPVRNKHLLWNIQANLGYNKNEVTSLGDYDELNVNSYTILRKGEAVGSFYGLVFDGVVQADEDISKLPTQNGSRPKVGQEKFRDINGDGKVNEFDRVILGHSHPDINYGLSSSLKFGRLDAFIQFQGTANGQIYNSLRRTLESPTDCYNVSSVILDSWTAENPSNIYPAVTDVRPYSYIDSRFVEDANYFKLKTLTVGYSIPLRFMKAGLHLTATATNLFTITNYKGYEPEIQSGVDMGDYPASRSFTLGVELTF
ncbi:MAG: TonB-dependent receptor [Prevotella sp.]|nr:TonB-dependent receptor [Prevotella sp.]